MLLSLKPLLSCGAENDLPVGLVNEDRNLYEK